MKEISFSWKELYDLVWSRAVTHIAKSYDISPTYLRGVCKNANIPLPSSGYWSKLKFNKEVRIEPLPDSDLFNQKIVVCQQLEDGSYREIHKNKGPI